MAQTSQDPSKLRTTLGWLLALLVLVGFAATLLCLMALIGSLTPLLWVRAGGALVVALAVPALIADRLLPETGPKPKGLVTKVFAALWLVFPLLFLLAARDYTTPLLEAESSRLMSDGFGRVGTLGYRLAGKTPPPRKLPPVPAPSGKKQPSGSASAQGDGVGSAQAKKKDGRPPSDTRGSKDSGCTYPKGPYGIVAGKTLPPRLRWKGLAPGSNRATTVTASELFDCDGRRGIHAVVIDVSQYG